MIAKLFSGRKQPVLHLVGVRVVIVVLRTAAFRVSECTNCTTAGSAAVQFWKLENATNADAGCGSVTCVIAVLVPCFNEEAAVATVVADFRKALPDALIFVYDNNSTDRTAAVARDAGAQVRS